jgi:hypothetical protein
MFHAFLNRSKGKRGTERGKKQRYSSIEEE